MSTSRTTPNPDSDKERINQLVDQLAEINPRTLELGVSLRDLTTFRIGGVASGICRIGNSTQACRFQTFARENRIPVYYLGGGSNILADDAGFTGLIFKIEIDTYQNDDGHVRVGAGLEFDSLIARTLADDLVGLEFASGIPGTVGGAIVGNAGCFGREIGELVTEATVLRPDGTLETITPADFDFGYRHSTLKDSDSLVLDAVLDLHGGDMRTALADRQQKLALRRQKHPVDQACAGSYFKNLPPATGHGNRQAAGELLEKIGAKQMQVGDAAVFDRHANIIVNAGAATCADVLALAARMKDAVRERFGIDLSEEVRHLTDGFLLQ